jgi:hypothetical protein
MVASSPKRRCGRCWWSTTSSKFMFVLSLVRQLCPGKLPVQPDVRLGEGADGEVFSIKDDPRRVLKLGVLYGRPGKSAAQQYQLISDALDAIQYQHPPAYVHLYEHGYLGTFSRQVFVKPRGRAKQDYIIYYYLMDKLQPITEDEGKVFHSILSHEDRGIEKNFSPEKIQEMLQGMSRGLDFDAEKVTIFCSNIGEARLTHLDIAVRNIMKNEAGEFKLIDLDRVSLGNV